MKAKNRVLFEAIAESLLKKYGTCNVSKTTLKMEGYSDKMASLIMIYVKNMEGKKQ